MQNEVGSSVTELRERLVQVARDKQAGRDKGDIKADHAERIGELRLIVNERLAGIVGSNSGKSGVWPAGDHLRERLKFVGDASVSAGANSREIMGSLTLEYFARFPSPTKQKAQVHVPYFFIQQRGGVGKGRKCQPVDQPFLYGFSAYELESGGTKLSPSAKVAMRSAIARQADSLLAQRDLLSRHSGGHNVALFSSAATSRGSAWRLSEMSPEDLVDWSRGSDPVIQSALSPNQLVGMSDSEVLGQVYELFDFTRSFGESVWALARKTEDPSVFFSYRRDDFEGAGRTRGAIADLARAVESTVPNGARVFWDDALVDGDRYDLELTRQAEAAWVFVALRGPNYVPWRNRSDPNAEDWCRNEYHAAQVGGADIIEVSVGGAPMLNDAERAESHLERVTTNLVWDPGTNVASSQADQIAESVATVLARKLEAVGSR